ncbi:MAG: ADP-ribosylation factor-like protein [Candidatus Helarchaeota archaeon]
MDDHIKEKLSNIVEVPEKIKSLKQLATYDLINIKGIDIKAAATLRNILHVNTIEELALKKITEEQFLMLKLLGISEYDLNVLSFICRLIYEERIGEDFVACKTLIVGLDNAGKTAILNVIQNKLNLNLMSKLTPTIGVNRKILEKYGMKHIVLDLGGQSKYRDEYIQKAEDYFLGVEFLIFVVDVQDPNRFEEAADYFKKILDILEVIKERPEILVIIHKVDPDIDDNPEIIKSIEFLHNQYDEILKDKDFEYNIIKYSIFYVIGENKSVINNIRSFFTTKAEYVHKEDEEIKDLINRIMNVLVDLSTSLEQRISNIEGSIENFRQWIEYINARGEKIPVELQNTQKVVKSDKSFKKVSPISQSIRDELKTLLKLRKTGLEKEK